MKANTIRLVLLLAMMGVGSSRPGLADCFALEQEITKKADLTNETDVKIMELEIPASITESQSETDSRIAKLCELAKWQVALSDNVKSLASDYASQCGDPLLFLSWGTEATFARDFLKQGSCH